MFILLVTEFKPGKIAWAEWRFKGKKIMWPCKIDKLIKIQNKYKVAIKYFEINDKTSSTFKLDLHKVELFFRNQKHFNYKVLLLNFKNQSIKFKIKLYYLPY